MAFQQGAVLPEVAIDWLETITYDKYDDCK